MHKMDGGAPLGPEDDGLHHPREGEQSWTETAWFAASVPERGLGLWCYPVFRTALGVMSCGVYVWEPGAEELWELPYYRAHWHLAIPDGAGATDFALPNGLAYRTLQPLRSYRLTYDDDALGFDLTFAALHEAHAFGVRDGRGHIDQFGRVTGEIRLREETIPVSCIEMRDRTWSPRRESTDGTRLGYTYGAGADGWGFHASTRIDRVTGAPAILTGFLLREGATHAVAAAERSVGRDPRGRPVRIELRLVDDAGAELRASGDVVSRLALPTPHYFVWASIVRWTLSDGTTAWGEDQDTWSPALLATFRRGLPVPAA